MAAGVLVADIERTRRNEVEQGLRLPWAEIDGIAVIYARTRTCLLAAGEP